MKSFSIQSPIVSFLTLMGFWYVMSGFFDITHTIMGVISVTIVMAINYKLKAHSFYDNESDVIKDLRFLYLPWYFIWLFWQIIVSGIHVAKILLTPSLPIKSSVVRFKVNYPNPHAKMILGNSITLTPGTLTVDINDDEFIVHAISPVSFEGIANDKMPQQVLKLFTTEMHDVVSDFEVIHSKEDL
ncbi:MAG: Na+/H+ antiporter subunit E [Gracilimonas sp.]|uniref:Na+/H+ antiporter subunit E n=1 Tax=Gracilimonas TaxID=649462 RepID=UPI001B167C39|nr:Na+/H+ antiporter subunit E [Gracilimonas sp.]MBO6585899.1 Na+/H+ antiporter subunit E [Gracilimonas sp.]MBO6616896.1 Na+/H+ antiporter subunit E [Gracilimonas sp.]